jgi:enoyl-CoA hydratase/carnithine racemase
VLAVRDEERVRTLTLTRPSALNAFSKELYVAVSNALTEAAVDAEVSVVVLTGEGRAFSAGVDLRDLEARQLAAGAPIRPEFDAFIDALRDFPKPLICAVNGLAVGVGATLLGLADLVVMSSEAKIQLPFVKKAIAPEAGSTFTYPRMAGRQATAWLMFSANWMSAQECLRAGLAWSVVEPAVLLVEAGRIAHEIAAHPVEALTQIKALLRVEELDGLAAARDRENATLQPQSPV